MVAKHEVLICGLKTLLNGEQESLLRCLLHDLHIGSLDRSGGCGHLGNRYVSSSGVGGLTESDR